MSEERRGGARFITELSAILRSLPGGTVLDERATAHDVSSKGFKLETQVALAVNAKIAFTLHLPEGRLVEGKGRVVWANPEPFATWAGVEITTMGWMDKRRLNHLLDPDAIDWARLGSLCVRFVVAITVIVAAHRLILSPMMRGVLSQMAPKILALMLMGWALINMFKKERR